MYVCIYIYLFIYKYAVIISVNIKYTHIHVYIYIIVILYESFTELRKHSRRIGDYKNKKQIIVGLLFIVKYLFEPER